MIVLSEKYPGILIICEKCGAVLAAIKSSDIYGENLVYCPLCKFANQINYNKNYDGIVQEDKENDIQGNNEQLDSHV